MAKIKLLVDTDILVDNLKGIRAARELFKTKEVDYSLNTLFPLLTHFLINSITHSPINSVDNSTLNTQHSTLITHYLINVTVV